MIEVVVSVGVLVVLLAAFFVFYRTQAFALLAQDRNLNVKESADIGLDFMLREIRMAGARPVPEIYPPTGCSISAASPTPVAGCPGAVAVAGNIAGFFALTIASPTVIEIQYDSRGNAVGDAPDGCPDDENELIRYSYNAGTGQVLRSFRDATNTLRTQVLINNVAPNGFVLRYYRADGTEITGNPLTAANRLRVASIRLTVTTAEPHPDPRLDGSLSSTQSATIFMRNPSC